MLKIRKPNRNKPWRNLRPHAVCELFFISGAYGIPMGKNLSAF